MKTKIKFLFCIILSLFLLLSLPSCIGSDDDGTDDGSDDGDVSVGGSVDGSNNETPSFRGVVLEKGGDVCLLKITDEDDPMFPKDSTVTVHAVFDNFPQFDVGDEIEVVFDGKVAMSYPPQVFSVSSIKIVA